MVAIFRAALCLAMLLLAQAATAQSAGALPPTDEREAKRTFEDGVLLLRVGRWDEAEVRFRQSLALTPHPSAMYDLAFVLYKQGRARESAELLQRLLAAPEDPPDSEYRKCASLLLPIVLAQLAVLTKSAVATTAPTPPASAPPSLLEPTPNTPFLSGAAPWATMGIGGALLVGAAVTGWLALQADDAVRTACPSLRTCDPRLAPTRDRAVQLGHVTDALLASGGAFVAGGVTWRLLISARPGADRQAAFVATEGAF